MSFEAPVSEFRSVPLIKAGVCNRFELPLVVREQFSDVIGYVCAIDQRELTQTYSRSILF